MNFKIFLELVEIKTKIASIFPFIIGLLFSLCYFNEFDPLFTLLFLLAMLLFDMTVTAINNYQDYVKAKDEHYNILFIFIMLILGFDIVFLFVAAVVFFIGVFYTYGPIPLSRMPLGEIFSGGTMGLGIFTMVVLINTNSSPIFRFSINFSQNRFALTGSIFAVFALIIASLPLIFTIANIMLANNLRDLDTDIKNHRYTLVYYIGRVTGMKLFRVLMYGSYVAILLGLVLRLFDWPILVTFLTFPLIQKNLKAHAKEVPAPHSFVYSLKNMVLFNSSYALGLLFSLIWQSVIK